VPRLSSIYALAFALKLRKIKNKDASTTEQKWLTKMAGIEMDRSARGRQVNVPIASPLQSV